MTKQKNAELLSTDNYDRFKYLDYNRHLNEGLVSRLVYSIGEIGYIQGKPVIVDPNMNVIDGQHRLEACKRLGIPVYYVIEKADAQKTMMHLNAQQTNWRTIDYVESWATKGIKCYELLKKFEETFKLGITNSMQIFFNSRDGKTVLPQLREGKTFTTNKDAYDIARFILKCDSVPYHKSSFFIRAVVKAYPLLNDEQKEKVLAGIMALPQQATTAAYLACFENIVNKKQREKNKISLTKA